MKHLCLLLSLWVWASSPVHGRSPVVEEAQASASRGFWASVKARFTRSSHASSSEVITVETKQVHVSSASMEDHRPVEAADLSSSRGPAMDSASQPIVVEDTGEGTSNAFAVNTDTAADTPSTLDHTPVISVEEDGYDSDISSVSTFDDVESFDVDEESQAMSLPMENVPGGEIAASDSGDYEAALYETEEDSDGAEEDLDDLDLAIKAAEMLSKATGVGGEAVAFGKEVAGEVKSVLKVHQVQEAMGELADIDVDTSRPFGEQYRQFLDRKIAGRYYNPRKYGARRSNFAIFGPLGVGKAIEYGGEEIPVPGAAKIAKGVGRVVQLGLDRIATPREANYSRPYSLYELGRLTHATSKLVEDVYSPVILVLTPEEVTDLARQAAVSSVDYMDHRVREPGKTIITEEDILNAVGTRYVNLDHGIPTYKTLKTSIWRRLKFWDRKKRLTARQARYLLTSTLGRDESGAMYVPYVEAPRVAENWRQWLRIKLLPKFEGRTWREGLFLRGVVHKDHPGTLKKSNRKRKRFEGAHRKVNSDYVRRARMERVR